MERLRAPGGCPWDREQTFDSIKPYTLEETYEVLDAIDNRDWPELAGELGDLLLQVLFYAEMAKEQQTFSIDDVLDRLSTKLIDRHPHVFGDAKADTSADVKRNWEALKVEERKKKQSAAAPKRLRKLKRIRCLPEFLRPCLSLLEAYKLSSRVGASWFRLAGCRRAVRETARGNGGTARASAGISRARTAAAGSRSGGIRANGGSRGASVEAGRRGRGSVLRAGKYCALSIGRS